MTEHRQLGASDLGSRFPVKNLKWARLLLHHPLTFLPAKDHSLAVPTLLTPQQDRTSISLSSASGLAALIILQVNRPLMTQPIVPPLGFAGRTVQQ